MGLFSQFLPSNIEFSNLVQQKLEPDHSQCQIRK